MEWCDEGYVLSTRPHGESSSIAQILCPTRGRCAGLIRGGNSRRLRPVLQAGNKITVRWHARLEEHLGSFQVELITPNAALIMQERFNLQGLNAANALCLDTLAEHQEVRALYARYDMLITHLTQKDLWPALYARFEMALLETLGYSLDISKCAQCGNTNTLAYISPRSGRAVCHAHAQPYLSSLLALPPFLYNTQAHPDADDVYNALRLSGYFLQNRVFEAHNKAMPEARAHLYAHIKKNFRNTD